VADVVFVINGVPVVGNTQPSCKEGDVLKITATASTGIGAIDAANFDLIFSLPPTDLSVLTYDADGVTVSYTCSRIIEGGILELEVVARGDYAVSSDCALLRLTITNGELAITDSLVTLERTAVPGTAVSSCYIGEELVLIVPFTDASANNLHSIMVNWGESDATASIYSFKNTDKNNRVFQAKHKYAKASNVGAVFAINVYVNDNAGSTDTLTLSTGVSLAVSVMKK
jgi:hypothetical protein